jgi:hypothetical protein
MRRPAAAAAAAAAPNHPSARPRAPRAARRSNLAFASLDLERDLGLNNAAFGLASGVFFVTYCLGQIPAQLLAVRLGTRRALALLAIGWGIVASSLAAVSSEGGLLAQRVFLGALGEAAGGAQAGQGPPRPAATGGRCPLTQPPAPRPRFDPRVPLNPPSLPACPPPAHPALQRRARCPPCGLPTACGSRLVRRRGQQGPGGRLPRRRGGQCRRL